MKKLISLIKKEHFKLAKMYYKGFYFITVPIQFQHCKDKLLMKPNKGKISKKKRMLIEVQINFVLHQW